MSFGPYNRNPSGIVFFGTSATDKLYTSSSTFTYDAATNALKLPNAGYLGSQTTPTALQIASNGNITLSQSLSIGGNLTINGTTTTVNSTTVTVEDPVIILGSGAPTTDDNKDRGIAFNWHNGTAARSGFFGWDDSAQGFALYATGNIVNEVWTGQLGWLSVQGVSGDLVGSVTGNASTATTLQNTRTFSVSGQTLAAAQNFNGGANVTLTTALDKSAISSQPTLVGSVDGTNDFILLYDASTDGLTKVNRSNFVTGLGSMSSFTISDGTNTQTISDAESLFFRSGAAISFTVSATDQVSGTLNASVAGNGLSMTSQVLAVGVGSGISVSADQVSVTAGSGLSVDANGVHVVAGTGLLNSAAGLQIGIGNGITGAADAISVTDGTGILVDVNGVHANLISYTAQTTAANAATTTASRTYAVQVDSSDKLVVNVPWTDTGMTFSISDGTTSETISNGNTLNFRSGAAVSFTVSATDQVSGTLNAAVAGNGLNMTSQVLAVGVGSGISVSADQVSVVGGSGLISLSDGVHLDLNEYSNVNIASGDRLMTLDSDNSTEQLTTLVQLGQYMAGTGLLDNGAGALYVNAGTGLSLTAGGLQLDFAELATQTIASGTSIATLHTDGATEARGTMVQLGQYMAGTTGALLDLGNGILRVNTGAGLEINSNAVRIATTAAGNGLTGGGGSALSVVAGTGLSVDSNGVHIDLSEYVTPVAVASGDSFLCLDSDGATEQRSTLVNLAQFMAGTGLADDGAGSLRVNVDNSTLEVNADTVRIKDLGVTEAKLSRTVNAVSTAITLSGDISLVTAGASNLNVYLPSASVTGKMVYIKKVDASAGAVVINGSSATIDSAPTITLYHQWESVILASNGTNWFIL